MRLVGKGKRVTRQLSVFTNMDGWEGFFRPLNETEDGKPDDEGGSDNNNNKTGNNITKQSFSDVLKNALQGGDIRKATEEETKAFFLRLSKRIEEQIEREMKFFNSPEGSKLPKIVIDHL